MALEVIDHRKSFKDLVALDSLSFKLEPGGAVALLGPNGAGKSTAVKILVSLMKPDRGQYFWQGEDLFQDTAKIRDLVGYVSQELAMDKVLTGLEFMRFCAGLLHLDWREHGGRARELLDQLGLGNASDRQVGDYSGGMKRRLDLAAALLHGPRILVLDEPTSGLDLEARELIWEFVGNFLNQGGSLILASHDFREVGALADEVLILDQGKMVRRGAPDSLKNELGAFILRLKTHEFMQPGHLEEVRRILAGQKDVLWHGGEEFATLVYTGKAAMTEIQSNIYQVLDAAGLAVYSLNIQKPTLEDVYRLALRSAS